MRLTVNLESDLYALAKSLAKAEDCTVSAAVNRLLRRSLPGAAKQGRQPSGGLAKHEWWGNELNFLKVPHRHLQGSTQVTDAWLAEMARRRKGRLATLDSGLAALHGDVAVLLPL